MNYFNTADNGGLPLKNNDFRFFQDAIKDAFKAIYSHTGVTGMQAMVISGCGRTVTGGTVSIDAGYIVIGGEICYVAAQSYTAPISGQVEFWTIHTGADSTGNKAFQNGISHDTYQVRTGLVSVASSVPAGSTSYADSLKMTWQNLVTQTVDGTNYTIDRIMDFNNRVQLRGNWYRDDPGGLNNVLVGTLPVGFRPAQQITFMLQAASTSSALFARALFTIDANGEIRFRTCESDFTPVVFDFGQIPPFSVS